MPIAPSGFDQDTPRPTIAGLGDAAARPLEIGGTRRQRRRKRVPLRYLRYPDIRSCGLCHSSLVLFVVNAGGLPRCQPFVQLRPAPPARNIVYRDSNGLFLADQDDQLLTAGDTGVEQVPLQHRIMLSHDWNYHGRVFRALALVDGRRIGRDQCVKFTESIGHGTAIETRGEFTGVGIDSVDIADVAIVDVLVIVILDLHDLVTRSEGPAEPFDFQIAGGIESGLQFDVERSRADTSAVHRAENLNIANGVESESSRDPGLHQFDDALDRDFGLFDRREVKIAIYSGRCEIGNSSLIDPMRARDDAALRGLAEHLCKTNDRQSAG